MKIDDTNSAVSATPTIGHDPQRQNLPQRPVTGKEKVSKTPQRASEAIKAPTPDRILYNRLEGVNEQSLSLAKKIRAIDKTMVQVEEKVRDMRTFLESIVKAYPPYPPGSAERVQVMRQFSALRKQIDQLMYPPPEEVSALQGTDSHPLAGEDFRRASIGLNLPELSDDSADSELSGALKSLDDAYKALQQKHREFIDDANQIIAALK